MTRPMLGTALAASLFMMANAAAAQNTAEPSGSTPPPTGSDRPSTSTPAPAPAPAVPAPADSPAPRTEVIVVPQSQAAPPPVALPPIELDDTAYPNGFADPTAPYGNDLSVAVQQESDGFDWGLLGLLGLFGLFGLYRRRDGYTRTVHAERYDDGRPPRV